jgi:excisionase family DNA binding protein
MHMKTHTNPATPQPARRRLVKISEAAEYLQVTQRTIRHMIADGRLTGYRIGERLVRLDIDEIEATLVKFGGSV